MTTSPDESRPSGISLYVLPDVLRPRIDAVLADLGLNVVAAPSIRGQCTFVTLPRGHTIASLLDNHHGVPDDGGPIRFVRSERIDAPRD